MVFSTAFASSTIINFNINHILRRDRISTAFFFFIFLSFFFCNTYVSLPYNGVSTNSALCTAKCAAVLTFRPLINADKAPLTLLPAAIRLSTSISYFPFLLNILPKCTTSFTCSSILPLHWCCILSFLHLYRFRPLSIIIRSKIYNTLTKKIYSNINTVLVFILFYQKLLIARESVDRQRKKNVVCMRIKFNSYNFFKIYASIKFI